VEYIFLCLGIYLILGLIALIIFDLITHNIRDRIHSASDETREKLIATGTYYSPKISLIITLLALWIFWVVAIFASFTTKKG